MADAVAITTPSPLEIRISRQFDAPPELVFELHTNPRYIPQWLLGPGGWTMPVCDVDLRVGGRFRYEWHHPDKEAMGVSGEFLEIDPPSRIVHREAFDQPWHPGDTIVTTALEPSAIGTLLTLTIRYRSEEARDIALKSPMSEGMEEGYQRLERVLAAMR